MFLSFDFQQCNPAVSQLPISTTVPYLRLCFCQEKNVGMWNKARKPTLQEVLVRMITNWEMLQCTEENELLSSQQEADYLFTEVGL